MPVTFFMKRPDCVAHQTEAPIIAVQSGEIGWWPIWSGAALETLNGGEITPDVIESALNASMFGWDAPIAYVANCYARSRS